MSLIRQVSLLLLVVLALAVGGAVGVNLVTARDTLQTQLRLKNADNAQALALALSQQHGDTARMALLIGAQADTGHYASIRLVPVEGAPIERRFDVAAGPAPSWFRALLPIVAAPGVAQVSDGWQAVGRVEVVSHVEHVYESLWLGGWQALLWMAAVGGVAGGLAWAGVRRLQRPLDATVAQAQALSEGRFVTVAEPTVPELQRVASAMNTMVERVRRLSEAQAALAERWREEAHCDRLTGLLHRAHFLDRLAALLEREDGAEAGGLMLVRLADLEALNRQFGRVAVDAALRAVAAVLQTYTDRVPDCLAGRLNGADFALFLPVSGLTGETAASLATALRASLPGGGIVAHVGAVEMRRGTPTSRFMAQADAALAQAELGEPFVPVVLAGQEPVRGEHAWREQLLAALDGGLARLIEFPVLAENGALLTLECPLRLPLEPDAPPEAAARWLPLAVRSRLTARVDREAVRLALEATAADGRSRSVNLAPASLADPDFVGALRELLLARPQAAQALWLEVAEGAAVDRFRPLLELVRQLHPLGVRIGLEHAGPRLHRIERLFELGLDFVKLDASVCSGVAGSSAAQSFVRSTVQLMHALGLQVHAEGVVRDDDARSLWACGVIGVTGPWASQRAAG